MRLSTRFRRADRRALKVACLALAAFAFSLVGVLLAGCSRTPDFRETRVEAPPLPAGPARTADASRHAELAAVGIDGVSLLPAAPLSGAPNHFRGRITNGSLRVVQEVALYCELRTDQSQVADYAFHRVSADLQAGQEAGFQVPGRITAPPAGAAEARCQPVQVIFATGIVRTSSELLHVDKVLAGASLGAGRTEWDAVLGAADCDHSRLYATLTCNYRNGAVTVLYVTEGALPGRAPASSVTIREGATPRGVAVGDSAGAVRRQYGAPSQEFPILLQYWDTTGRYGWFRLEFHLAGGIVKSIQAMSPM